MKNGNVNVIPQQDLYKFFTLQATTIQSHLLPYGDPGATFSILEELTN